MTAGGWLPIESAPRDGSEIVCWLGGPCFAIERESGSLEDFFRILRWSTSYGVFGQGGNWTDGFCTLGDGLDVTHWMPLPPGCRR